jgi:hypothetical protein
MPLLRRMGSCAGMTPTSGFGSVFISQAEFAPPALTDKAPLLSRQRAACAGDGKEPAARLPALQRKELFDSTVDEGNLDDFADGDFDA